MNKNCEKKKYDDVVVESFTILYSLKKIVILNDSKLQTIEKKIQLEVLQFHQN